MADAGADRIGSVEELQQLFLDSKSIDDFLDDLIRHCVDAMAPFETACGLTLIRDGRELTVASSDQLARDADEAQYGHDQGPCLEAFRTGSVVMVNDLSTETRWPKYRPQALERGVAASLSTPVEAMGRTVGALNLYATRPHAFSRREQDRMLRFSAQIAGVLAIAIRFAEQGQVAADLRAALASRTTIDQALGVIMGQSRCSADDAFAILRRASQNRNQKIRDIAAEIILSVTGHAPVPGPAFRTEQALKNQ